MLATPNSPVATVPLAPQAAQPANTSRRPVDLIVIHCSATASGKPLTKGKPGMPGYKHAAQVIDDWHAQRGFARRPAAVQAFNKALPHIGYHFVIDLSGAVRSGRALSEIGAHAQFWNTRSVGICLVGGSERDAKYTREQWKSLAEVVTMLLADYGIAAISPKLRFDAVNKLGFTEGGGVCGHRDLSPDKNANGIAEPVEWLKTCPGFSVAAWMKNGMQPTAAQIFEVAA